MLLVAATVSTGERILRPGWITLTDGLVADIGSGTPPGTPDLDAGDGSIVPGFVDVHLHGGGGASFDTTDLEEALSVVGSHRRRGTTTMLASLVTATPDALAARVAVLADLTRAGEIAGIHLEGPWLSPARAGAHDPDLLRRPDVAELTALLNLADGAIRMVTLAPELPGAFDLIAVLWSRGVVVAAGHTDADYEMTHRAIDAGVRVGTHLCNAMRPLHHREPGPILALLTDPRVTVELIGDGIHLHPMIFRRLIDSAGADRTMLVTDAMAASGMPDGSYRLGELEVVVADGAARLADGTIAGSTIGMADNFRAARAAGPDPTAVRLTATTPARRLGLPAGTLRVGEPADLVVLTDEMALVAVLRRGSVVQ